MTVGKYYFKIDGFRGEIREYSFLINPTCADQFNSLIVLLPKLVFTIVFVVFGVVGKDHKHPRSTTFRYRLKQFDKLTTCNFFEISENI